ncbi:MAG: MotA/TolQ/ExbB proton channel family protein [Bdellovibrionia bacterium]
MEMLSKMAIAFEQGGVWMYPILLAQIVSLAIIAERTYSLYFKRKPTQMGIALTFEDSIRRGEIENVVTKAGSMSHEPVAKAIEAGAKAARNLGGKEEIQAKMDEVLIAENSTFDSRIPFLAMLGNVATLIGLLGTITGMAKSFAAVSYASPAEKAALLATGIAEAMNTTAYGLIAAIPALIGYAILMSRANKLAEDLNQGALKAFNWLSYAYEPVGLKNQRQKATDSNREINA